MFILSVLASLHIVLTSQNLSFQQNLSLTLCCSPSDSTLQLTLPISCSLPAFPCGQDQLDSCLLCQACLCVNIAFPLFSIFINSRDSWLAGCDFLGSVILALELQQSGIQEWAIIFKSNPSEVFSILLGQLRPWKELPLHGSFSCAQSRWDMLRSLWQTWTSFRICSLCGFFHFMFISSIQSKPLLSHPWPAAPRCHRHTDAAS